MKNTILALAIAVVAAGFGLSPTAQPRALPLFDGTLGGATIEDGGTFTVADGVLRAEGPEGWLRFPQRVRDFRLHAALRFVTPNGDSGIFVRALPDRPFARGWPNRSYQVQLLNPLSDSPLPPLGGLFRHGMPPGDTAFDQTAVRRAFTGTGEWQRLEIEVVGTAMTVRLNGTVVTRAAGLADVEGYIGVQSETSAVEFRRIEIERLERASSPATAGRQGVVIDTGAFTPFVENMDRSLAFYHDVFGMDVPPPPAAGGPRPYNPDNPGLVAFFDIPGARERHQSARVPGIRTTVEAMEIQQVPFRTVPLRLQDPGNATLVLFVRDIDATLAKVKAGRYPVVTPGGSPVTMGDGTRAVIVRDVDNRFVELRQPPEIPATAPAHNIIDIGAMVTVADVARTLQVYRDVFGFEVEGPSPFKADPVERALTGFRSAEQRHGRARARDSQLWLEFVEFRGIDRRPLQMKIQDRGATRLQLRAQNIDAVVDAARRAGLTIVTQGGAATPIPPNFKGALIADPNNFFVSLFEPCDGCAPPLRR